MSIELHSGLCLPSPFSYDEVPHEVVDGANSGLSHSSILAMVALVAIRAVLQLLSICPFPHFLTESSLKVQIF